MDYIEPSDIKPDCEDDCVIGQLYARDEDVVEALREEQHLTDRCMDRVMRRKGLES
jgi:hypothetical protein